MPVRPPRLCIGFRGCVVEEGDAVPQDVAVFVRDEQRALADGEVRRRADAGEVVLGPDVVVAVLGQLREGRPLLPTGRDVLPRVGADGALGRRFRGLRELGAAGGADEVVHGRRWYAGGRGPERRAGREGSRAAEAGPPAPAFAAAPRRDRRGSGSAGVANSRRRGRPGWGPPAMACSAARSPGWGPLAVAVSPRRGRSRVRSAGGGQLRRARPGARSAPRGPPAVAAAATGKRSLRE